MGRKKYGVPHQVADKSMRFFQAYKTLPEGYEPVGTLDLSRGKVAFLVTQLAALVLFFVFAWLFGALALALRVNLASLISLLPVQMLWAFLAALALMLVLHEGVHGAFFALCTGARPRFGFKGAYAYAAAPDWYIPRNAYVLISLAPLILLSVVGMILMPFVSSPALFVVLAIPVLNAAGSVGIWR
jgi:hypothetical protein